MKIKFLFLLTITIIFPLDASAPLPQKTGISSWLPAALYATVAIGTFAYNTVRARKKHTRFKFIKFFNQKFPVELQKLIFAYAKYDLTQINSKSNILCLAGMPNGNIISGGEDCVIRIWDPNVSCNNHIKQCQYTTPINGIVVSNTENIFFTSSNELIKIMDYHMGPQFKVQAGGATFLFVCFGILSDGRVAAFSKRSIYLFTTDDGSYSSAQTEDLLRSINGESEITCAILFNGKIIFGCANGSIMMWNPQFRGSDLIQLNNHGEEVTCLAATPAGNIVSGSSQGTLKLWSIRDKHAVQILNHGAKITCAVGLQDNTIIFGDTKALYIWDPIKNCVESVFTFNEKYQEMKLILLPNGMFALAQGTQIIVGQPYANDLEMAINSQRQKTKIYTAAKPSVFVSTSAAANTTAVSVSSTSASAVCSPTALASMVIASTSTRAATVRTATNVAVTAAEHADSKDEKKDSKEDTCAQ